MNLKIEKHLLKLIIVLGTAYMASRYDFSLSTLAVPQFQNSFGLSSSEATFLIAFVKLGAIPAVILTFYSDKIGRRPIFLYSILGFAVSALIAASAQNAAQLFIGLFLTRLFTMIGELLAVVLIAEAAPKEIRGYLMGILAFAGTLGDAVSIILYGFIGEDINGWRTLYYLGALPGLLYFWWRGEVKESEKFLSAEEANKEIGLSPLSALREYKKEVTIMFLAMFVFWIPISPSLSLISQYLQIDLNWSPANVTIVTILAGVFGMLSNLFAGKLCDYFGRKPIAIFGTLLTAIGMGFVFSQSNFFIIVISYGVALMGWFAAVLAFRTITTEMVSTQIRATVSSVIEISGTLGAFCGVLAVGFITKNLDKIGVSILWVLPTIFIAIILLLFTKETKNTNLV